ncbi:MAG TPA: proprotein convertase P-domain-containing protein [Myxococcaceae bacterium]|nr:proprotein convertase P-domain-containing protein [Myxococcaceae bacterium]
MTSRIHGPQQSPILPNARTAESRSPSRPAAPAASDASRDTSRFSPGSSSAAERLSVAQRHVALPSARPGQLWRQSPTTVTGSAAPNAAIPDNGTGKAESTIRIADALDVQKVSVNLDIPHSYKGDVVVTLTSPSGKSAVVHNRTGGSADDVKGKFDLSAFAGEKSQGDWKLTVEDKGRGDVGTLKSWSLEVTGTPKAPPPPPAEGVISKGITPNAAINDNQTVTSTLDVPEDATVDKLQLDLDIAHSYRGDLVVTLTSPSGKSAVVSNKQGGSADDLKGSFDLSAFAGEKATGQWKLTVQDSGRGDTGTLKGWGLKITPKEAQPPPPPPPPAGDDSDPMTHIRYLASDEMKGRDSPSAELHAAAAYVRDFSKKYGLTGPNVNNPEDPYVQKFNLFSFAGSEHHEDHGVAGAGAAQPKDPGHWGVTTFDEGFFLEDDMKPETLALINQRYEDTMRAEGKPVAPALNGRLRSPAELRQLAQHDGTVPNVMAKLEGTGPNKHEVIVVMAHLDHVGVGKGGVNNGADDNASGSAVLMSAIPALVEAQKQGKLDRSIVFVWTGAEEKGLVGSQYFVDHPIPGLGLKEIAGVVNVDMVGRWDDQRMSIVDTGSRGQANYFRDIAEKANAQMADPFDKLNRDINQFRDRQDGAVFTRKGEDVLFLFEGLSNPNGGGGLIPEYHGPDDDVDKIIRDNGGNKPRRVKDFFVNVVTLAANRTAQAAAPERRTAAAAAEQPVFWR